jgi:hypothetical protein
MGNFSKIEAGKFDLEYCAFDLRTVVEEALDVVAPLAHRKQLELCAPLDDLVPAGVVGDPFTAQADSAERAQQCGQVYGDRRSRPQREPRGNWNAMNGERERWLKADMDDYLSKPVRAEDLFNKLKYWIGRDNGECVAANDSGMKPTDGVRAALGQFISGMEGEGIDREDVDLLFTSFLKTTAE